MIPKDSPKGFHLDFLKLMDSNSAIHLDSLMDSLMVTQMVTLMVIHSDSQMVTQMVTHSEIPMMHSRLDPIAGESHPLLSR